MQPWKMLVIWLVTLSTVAGESLDLAGDWRLRLDPQDAGLAARWFSAPMVDGDRITLPSTTDQSGFGSPLDGETMTHTVPFPVTTRFPAAKEPERADEHGYLVRKFLFVGPAWYEREVQIPATWAGRPLTLQLERAIWKTDVWFDGEPVGSCDSLVAEHQYEWGPLKPGLHRITVRVDNRMLYNLATVTHAYGPETQSRWNGLVGALTLRVHPRVSIRSIDIDPASDRCSVQARMRLVSIEDQETLVPVRLQLLPENHELPIADQGMELPCARGESFHDVTLQWKQPAEAWDEFRPVRYRLRAIWKNHAGSAEQIEIPFGFRHVERVGRQIQLNGRRVFLRGTLDCCVYPRTGHPPTDVAEWERILATIKEYGFNHVRFHTWCPPDAAFEAADRLGVYLQAETPAWIDDWIVNTVTKPQGIGHDPVVTAFLRNELSRMSKAYGNHPSFLLCAIGNEFGMQSTDWNGVSEIVEEIKQSDPRRLYAACGARRQLEVDDYWFTHQTGVRARGVGPAHTEWDFQPAAEAASVPVIAHETGQRPVYPDYETLLPKFTGPLLPLNYDRYRRACEAAGLSGQVPDFVRSSAQFQYVQYKAEHEAMLRTPDYAGYQLLMLNDFTGQSEALVGILDPFWETKGIVKASEVRAWNAPTVLLARFPRYVWSTNETFHARLEIAHYGARDLSAGPVEWTLEAGDGEPVAQGQLDVDQVVTVGLSKLGDVTVPLDAIRAPSALSLIVRFAGLQNRWNLWIYPHLEAQNEPEDVRIATTLDEDVRSRLRRRKGRPAGARCPQSICRKPAMNPCIGRRDGGAISSHPWGCCVTRSTRHWPPSQMRVGATGNGMTCARRRPPLTSRRHRQHCTPSCNPCRTFITTRVWHTSLKAEWKVALCSCVAMTCRVTLTRVGRHVSFVTACCATRPANRSGPRLSFPGLGCSVCWGRIKNQFPVSNQAPGGRGSGRAAALDIILGSGGASPSQF